MEHLSVGEAAETLGLSVPTIKRYIYDGKLHSVKLPGGQHRIPRSEIDRVLAAGHELPEGPTAAEAVPGAIDDRVAVLERWVTELQADVERLTGALDVVSRFCARSSREPPPPHVPAPGAARHRVLILGPGCRRCDTLYDLTVRVLQAAGLGDVPIERVKNMDDIASFGPIVTPAVVVDDRVVSTGRMPTEVALRDILWQHLR